MKAINKVLLRVMTAGMALGALALAGGAPFIW